MVARKLVIVTPNAGEVINIKEYNGPSGVKLRTYPGTRTPKHGEIVRLIKVFLVEFFENHLNAEQRHETLDIYYMQEQLGDKLSLWLGGILRTDGRRRYVPPTDVINILRRTVIDGCAFHIQGNNVRLMRPAEPGMQATARFQFEKQAGEKI